MSFLLLATLAMAGTDADVTTGVVALNQGDYAKAFLELQQGLEDPSTLKPKNVPKAWYNLGQAFMATDRPVEAAMAYANALDADIDGAWAKQMQATVVPQLLLQTGLIALSEASNAGTPDPGVLTEAERLLTHAIALIPEQHTGYDLRGQVRDLQGDKVGAQADYTRCLELAEASPPASPDILLAYVAYRSALLKR
ncbi:MAG: hypothetical protein GY913_31390 [Proteobacteria bacterium]|nr:hypothetical protein [Pseudomonadota bacterium]MCP4921424.1 hypothetical protein [Pseudomonadota bacterium]